MKVRKCIPRVDGTEVPFFSVLDRCLPKDEIEEPKYPWRYQMRI